MFAKVNCVEQCYNTGSRGLAGGEFAQGLSHNVLIRGGGEKRKTSRSRFALLGGLFSVGLREERAVC